MSSSNPIDKNLINKILNILAEHSNEYVTLRDYFPEEYAEPYSNHKASKIEQNLLYLYRHHFINVSVNDNIIGEKIHIGSDAMITEQGIDYLLQDQGLTGYKNTITVQFSEETIRALLQQKIMLADIPQEKKNALLEHLKSAGAKALEGKLTELLTQAINQIPDIASWMSTLSGF